MLVLCTLLMMLRKIHSEYEHNAHNAWKCFLSRRNLFWKLLTQLSALKDQIQYIYRPNIYIYISLYISVLILDFWGPYAELCRGHGGCWDERMNETHLSVFHSISNRAHGKRSRNNISSVTRYTFNSFFSLEQETVRHSRYMIWLIFT